MASVSVHDKVIPITKSFLPWLDFNKPHKYAISQGASSYSLQKLRPNSLSDNLVAFSFNSFNNTWVVPRQFLAKCVVSFVPKKNISIPPVNLTIADWGAGVGGAIYNRLGLALLGLNSVITSNNLTLNDYAWTYVPRSSVQQLFRFGDTDDAKYSDRHYSTCGCFRDSTANYTFSATGSRNPMTAYELMPWQQTRYIGNYKITTTDDGMNITKVIVEWYEPVVLPPLIAGGGAENLNGFTQLRSLDLQMNLEGLENMFKIVPPVDDTTISGVTDVHFENGTELWFFTYTPPPSVSLPDVVLLVNKRYEHQIYDTPNSFRNSGTFSKTNRVQVNSQALVLKEIPARIYCYVKLKPTARSQLRPDFTLEIESANLKFNNREGLLTPLQEVNLWELSARNGLQGSFKEWKSGGCILAFSPPDLNNTDYDVASVGGQFNFYIELQCIAPDGYEYDDIMKPWINNAYDFHIVFEYDTLLTIKDQCFEERRGFLSKEMIDGAFITHQEVSVGDNIMMGGAFWDTLKRLAQKGMEVGQKAVAIGRTLAPYAQQALQTGMEGYQAYKQMTGRGLSALKKKTLDNL